MAWTTHVASCIAGWALTENASDLGVLLVEELKPRSHTLTVPSVDPVAIRHALV